MATQETEYKLFVYKDGFARYKYEVKEQRKGPAGLQTTGIAGFMPTENMAIEIAKHRLARSIQKSRNRSNVKVLTLQVS